MVVDLETTGGGADTEAITEIGAVKVRGGEVLGEFETLVDPGRGIPPFITRADRHHRRRWSPPRRRSTRCCPRSSSSPAAPCSSRTTRRSTSASSRPPAPAGLRVAGAARGGHRRCWPAGCSTSDEVPNCRLGHARPRTSRPPTTPIHRALADARATVDVLHGADRAARRRSACTRWRSCARSPRRSARRSGASGTSPSDLPNAPGRVRVPGRQRPTALRRDEHATSGPGSGSTSRPARRAPGSARWSRSPSGSTRSSARTRWRPRSASCG